MAIGNILANRHEFLTAYPAALANQLALDLFPRFPEASSWLRKTGRQITALPVWLDAPREFGSRHSGHLATTGINRIDIHFLQFSPDGEQIIFIDRSGVITRWNWRESAMLSVPAPESGYYHDAVALSENEILLVSEEFDVIFKTDHLWKGDWQGLHFKKLDAPEGRLGRVAFNPVRRQLLQTRIGQVNHGIIHCQSDQWKPKGAWLTPALRLRGSEPVCNYLAVSPNGQRHAVCLGDGSIAVSNGWLGKVFSIGAFCCEFLDDCHLIATGQDSFAVIIDIRCGVIDVISFLFDSPSDYLAVHPNRQEIAIAHRNGQLTLLTWVGRLIHKSVAMSGVVDTIQAIAFSPCGRYLAVSGRSKVRVLDYNELKQNVEAGSGGRSLARPFDRVQILPQSATCLVLDLHRTLYSSNPTADDRHLPRACGSFWVGREHLYIAQDDAIVVAQASTGTPVSNLRLEGVSTVRNLALSSDERLVALDLSSEIVVLARESAPPNLKVLTRTPLAELLQISEPERPLVPNQPLLFCSSQELLAISCTVARTLAVTVDSNGYRSTSLDSPKVFGNQLCLLHIPTGVIRSRFAYQGFCSALCEVPNHRCLAVGLGYGPLFLRDPDGSEQLHYYPGPNLDVHFLDVASGKDLFALPALGDDGGVTAMAYDSAEDLLFVAFRTGRLAVASVNQRCWLSSVCFPDRLFGLALEPHLKRIWLADNAENSTYPMLTSLNYTLGRQEENL